MSDTTQETTDNKDVVEPSPEATQPEVQSVETPDTEEVKLSKHDYAKLVSQRDKNFDSAKTAEERLDAIEAEKARDDYIKDFLKENKDTYEFVEADDLKSGTSPEEIKEIATRIQAKAELIKDKVKEQYNNVPSPQPLTGQAKTDHLNKLQEQAHSGDTSAFGKMLEVEGII